MTVTQRQRGDTVASDHRGLGVLDLGQCLRRLAASPIGRIAFRSHGETVILPVNHVLDDTVIAFRTRWDSTLAAAVNDESIAFEVDHYDPSAHTGWSVLVKGIASTVYDDAACERLESLLGVPWAGPEDEIFWTLIRPEEISGRELSASRGECGCC
jgi:hypothetical protein